MYNKIISIIIPVFNLAKYLNRCLESIVTQSWTNLEILLIDDGSTDGSSELCDKWKLKDSRIRVIHKQNGGVSSARNLGLEYAKGDFITFVDGDDYILPGMYECLMSFQIKYNTDIAICGFSKEQKNGSFIPNYRCDDVKILSQLEQISCLLTNKYYTCSCCDKIFKRNMIKNLRFNIKITNNEDLLFCYEAMKNSLKAIYISEPFYRYCANDNTSASRKPFDNNQMTMLDVWDYIHKDGLIQFSKIKSTINCQYYRNYIVCAMKANDANCQSNIDWKRMKSVIKYSLFKIIFCKELAIGYKWNAIKILFYR